MVIIEIFQKFNFYLSSEKTKESKNVLHTLSLIAFLHSLKIIPNADLNALLDFNMCNSSTSLLQSAIENINFSIILNILLIYKKNISNHYNSEKLQLLIQLKEFGVSFYLIKFANSLFF